MFKNVGKNSRKLFAAMAFVVALGSLGTLNVSAKDYVVQKGDYLVKIAEEHNTTWRELAEYNKLANPSLIYPDQVIVIPDYEEEATEAPEETAAETSDEAVQPEETAADEGAVQENDDVIQLTILGTSDLHGNIWGYSYEDQSETANNGFARVVTYINEVRSEQENVILIDNGDTIQGTILTDDLYNKKLIGEPHPMMKVMNAAGYDAMALGNHEFNFGLDLISKIDEEADFPLLSANTKYKADGSDFLPPYTVVERDGLKIGIIGLVTPNIPRWDGEKVDALTFEALGATAAKYAAELKEQEEVDIIVAAVHAGMTAEFDEDGGSDAAAMVPVEAPDVDVMLIGHYHTVVTETEGNTVIGGPRNAGRDVVRFDLTIDVSGEEAVVTDSSVVVVDMAAYEPDENIRTMTQTEHQNTIDFIFGGGDGEEGSGGGVFGAASANFQPENEIRDIPEGKLRDTAVMDLINTVQLKYSGADVSAAALFKDTSDIKAGDITYANIFDIYKFDNTLYTVEVTGKELKAYMEWSAACYNQWVEGDISISFDPEKPGYLYDMFEGVDYKIDLSQPAGSRIKDVKFKGADLQDDQVLTLAVNNYRYSSALKAENIISGTRNWESPVSIRDYLVEYITEMGVVTPEVNNNWEITGVNLESPYRAQIIEMVNNGELEVPYDSSLNVPALIAAGVIAE